MKKEEQEKFIAFIKRNWKDITDYGFIYQKGNNPIRVRYNSTEKFEKEVKKILSEK